MSCLKDFPEIANNLTTCKKSGIIALHKLVFQNEGDRNNRKRLRMFEGFEFNEKDENYNKLLAYVEQNLNNADLTTICGVLGLDYKVEHLVLHIFQNLTKGSLMGNTNNEDDEQNTEDEDDEQYTEDEGDAELEGEYEQQSGRNETDINNVPGSQPSRSKSDNNLNVYQSMNVPRFAMNFRDIEESVRTFDGSNQVSIETWLDEFEETGAIMGWDDFQKFVFAKKLLKGIAALFIQSERGIISWQKLRTALITEFRTTTNSALIHKQLSQRKMQKDESYQEYFLHMKDIAARGKIEDEALIQYVIDGINDSSTNKMVLYGAQNQKEFKEKLKCYEIIRSKTETPRENKNYEKKPFVKNNPFRQPKDTRCFYCGLKGHASASCRYKEKGVKCFNCNEFGHFSSDCTNAKYEQKTSTTKKNTRLVSPNNDLMMKKVVLEEIPMNALLDTGCKYNLLTESIFKKIKNKQLLPNSTKLVGFGNKNHVLPLGSIKCVIQIDDVDYEMDILVVNDEFMDVSLIIGESFCSDKEVKIDREGIHFKSEIRNMMAIQPETEEIEIDRSASTSAKQEVHKIISDYKPEKVKDTKVKMTITLKDETPIFSRPNRLPLAERQIVDEQIEKWLKEGIIEPSDSEFSSPVILVKKRDGSPRLCIDYRKINRVIVKDRFPLPLIEDQLDRLKNVMFCSTIDLKNGFFHVPVEEASRKYTSFVTHNGQYQFVRVPFGLCNSPSVFQRHINALFRVLSREGIALPYVDDVIIPAENEEQALINLKKVMKTCKEYGLELNFKKCQFLKRKVEFLGYEIENKTIAPSPRKVEELMKYKVPQTVKQVQSFLGLAGYFRKFIPSFSIIAKPLSDLIKKDRKFEITNTQILAFNTLKNALCNKPVLSIFNPDYETELHTDASSEGYGAVLMQRLPDDNQLHPTYYMSKKTSDAERKYSSYELEILAVIEALKKFRVYLLGIHFKLVTDCNAFTKTLQKKDLCTRVARWIMLLEEYDYSVEHRSGSRMKHVDALSRYPVLKICEESIISKVKIAQQNDDELKTIINLLGENEVKNDYFLKGGVLYKQHEDYELIVVPKGMQNDIIRKTHEQGHFGVQKVKDLLCKDFYIPKIDDKIRRQIDCCVKCVIVNRKSGRKEGELHPIEKGEVPLHTLHIDFLGPMESTNKNYKHIFVMVDAFSKFCWLYPTKTTSAACALTKLQAQSVTFGNPAQIISDRGAAFTAEEFKKYCENENIKHILITTGLPRANGQVERMNSVIISVLAKLSIEDPSKWYKHVETVQKFINSTTSKSTGFTPFELMTGVKMRNKEDLHVKSLIDEELKLNFAEKRDEMRASAKEQILKIQQQNRHTYNLRRKPPNQYKKGDIVAIKRTQLGPGLKLKPKFLGPYRIMKTKPNDTYDVERIGGAEGPIKTTSCAEYLKYWPNQLSDDENEFEAN